MKIKFTKMHGLGNDYVYVFGDIENPEQISIKLSDRHFGIGADGLILISDSELDEAEFRMRIFNADGSEAMMCGNGIRCVGKYLYDNGYTKAKRLAIETNSGIRVLNLTVEGGKVSLVEVDMGKARVGSEKRISVDGLTGGLGDGLGNGLADDCALSSGSNDGSNAASNDALSQEVLGNYVDVGNPHFVVIVDDAEKIDLSMIGPKIEKHPEFPGGINVEFISVTKENELRMRVWERGSGITMACGTGACASAAASVFKGICDFNVPIKVELDGGILEIEVGRDFEVKMTGPAVTVFEGEVEI